MTDLRKRIEAKIERLAKWYAMNPLWDIQDKPFIDPEAQRRFKAGATAMAEQLCKLAGALEGATDDLHDIWANDEKFAREIAKDGYDRFSRVLADLDAFLEGEG